MGTTQTAAEKLKILSAQIDFIAKLNDDFAQFVDQEILGLHQMLDKLLKKNPSEAYIGQSIAHIKEMLQDHLEQLEQEGGEVTELITQQREILHEAAKLPEGARKNELIELVIEQLDLPGKLDWEAFKKEMFQLELERRKGFKDYVDEIASTIEEGDVVELEAFLEQQALDDAEARRCNEGLCDDDDCFNCNEEELDEEAIASMLKKMQEPYLDDAQDEEQDDDEEEDCDELTPTGPKGRCKK